MSLIKPSGMCRAKYWSSEVENAYRFQLAGYRDELEYTEHQADQVEKWTGSGFVKKLKRKDGSFYYFDQKRECPDKDINKCKLYRYEDRNPIKAQM
ncbi:hypothetical protein P879_09526 [Paragonimus westermani]|uniref:Meiosis expressed gene 1 protein n=1 Tax=Paragonimus westermani TaxID=34504 RepID=A0A8T0DFU4_9TREM|nr:hypothetical protein P879_09526 [Paragonimus westermani]